VVGEAGGIDRRARDDELEVGAAGEELGEVADEEVDRETAFVGLVEDDRVVAAEVAVARQFGEQHAVGHHLDRGVAGRAIVEPHLVADDPAQLDLELGRDALGDRAGRDPTRLRVSDPLPAQLEADLRQLRRLAGSGLPRDDHDLVLGDRARDVLPPATDGQFGRVRDPNRNRHELSIVWLPIPSFLAPRPAARVRVPGGV
jgi:hypothetical protein